MSCCQESVLECKENTMGPVWKDTQNVLNDPPNPWNRTKCQEFKQPNLSFRDLMSEDLAKNLQQSEEEKIFPELRLETSGTSASAELEPTVDTSNDFMLAYLLQQSYNEEHDNLVQREENHFNKNSKLCVSFKNYKVCSEFQEEDSDEEYQVVDDENRAVDKFEESKRTDPVIPACGYIRHNNRMITKHDKTLTGRRNAEKVMNFPPGFNTGDAGGFDMQISNKVYNNLHRRANEKDTRKQRIKDKVDKATSIKAFDVNSRLIIFKLFGNSVIENLNEIISTGKESVVVHAYGGVYEDEELPHECAIKVFKTTLTDFKTREKYIRDDYRFKNRISRNNNKMTIQLWAEKEFHNLRRLQKAKIPSPNPFLVKSHVLLMSFIGNDSIAAPKLKHANLNFMQLSEAYKQIIEIMTIMFRRCKLVHGDMSEYNILWHEDKCWVIDLGQAVEPTYPHALKFFYRDCTNILTFFRNKGIPDLPSPLELFNIISGINLNGPEDEVDRLIEEFEANQELWKEEERDGEDKFEFLWNEINNGKLSPPELESQECTPSRGESLQTELKKKTKKSKRKSKGNRNMTNNTENLAMDISVVNKDKDYDDDININK